MQLAYFVKNAYRIFLIFNDNWSCSISHTRSPLWFSRNYSLSGFTCDTNNKNNNSMNYKCFMSSPEMLYKFAN